MLNKTFFCFLSLAVGCMLSALPQKAFAFQLFPTAQRVAPSYKNFKYYISSTYYNYTADGQLPITEIHIQGMKKTLDILTAQAASAGVTLTFEYAGTFDYDSEHARNAAAEADDAFDKTIYYDFTSNELWGRQYVVSAATQSKKSLLSGNFAAGGVVRFNSDFINFLHPNGNFARLALHETLHVLGLDHSTVSSAEMAYTEFWYPTLSADDLLGLQNLYDVGPSTSLSFNVTLSGAPAGGVEVVAINTTTGVSYVGMTNASGGVTVHHIPFGTYVLASRELTPTGPCFTNPTRGFLTSFYVSAGVATNDYAAASPVTLVANSQFSISLALISGKKQFDCHFASTTALSDEACGSLIAASSISYNEKCYLHMSTQGVRFPVLAENDKSIANHKTDTDTTSNAQASVVYQSLGTSPGLVFHAATFAPDFGNTSKIDLEVLATAATGTHAALCKAGGQTALISSFIEVQNFGGALDTSRLLPDLKEAMNEYGLLPKNFSRNLRPGDSDPGVGPRPPNKQVITSPSSENDSSSRKRKWYEFCGAVALQSKRASAATGVMLLAPLVLVLGVRRKTKSRDVNSKS